MWCLVVLHPDRLWEGCTVGLNHTLNVTKAFASPFSGGVFWDPADNMYKMWYRCNDGLQCYATSVDGIAWTKPMLDVVNGTNIVISERVDGATVWLDGQRNVPRSARFKMAAVFAYNDYRHYTILHSADGVHWIVVTNSTAGSIADRSTVFFNPFRSKWVYSIKQDLPPPFGRSRAYWEAEDLDTGATWGTPNGVAVYNWTNADEFDPPWCDDVSSSCVVRGNMQVATKHVIALTSNSDRSMICALISCGGAPSVCMYHLLCVSVCGTGCGCLVVQGMRA
eukprot:m.1077028 g.1077028  ORF g.1077028 m.1077028 type:complete len:280 (+) comp24251_c0_seq3:833-1672(+)